MKEAFIEWKPNATTLVLLAKISEVLSYFGNQGYRLTLRQLYYQLVSRGLIPNSLQSYHRIGNIVNKGRLAGDIDWAMIEDRVRVPSSNYHWDNPKQIVESAARGYYRDHWEGQENYVEVWCEKDAVSNIIQPVCEKWDVTFMANRGYTSQSAMYEAFHRYQDEGLDKGKELFLIYLGDHDPSGIDMTRDIEDRMGRFMYSAADIPLTFDVDRIALNMDQVNVYKPPENPVKMTDSRWGSYVEKYGDKSWELDALEPKVLADLVEDSILQFLDLEKWKDVEAEEERERQEVLDMVDRL